MSEHAQRSWIFCGNHVDDGSGNVLFRAARCWGEFDPADIMLASAAPELLSACVELLACVGSEYGLSGEAIEPEYAGSGGMAGIVYRARRAVAKARGDGEA